MTSEGIDVLCVFGTRPELIKVAPVVRALRATPLRVVVLATGQHVDLLDREVAQMVAPAHMLNIQSDGTMLHFLSRAQRALHTFYKTTKPRCVLVQGDTMSAFAAAKVAMEMDIPIAHVEAGVRSHNLDEPWPEEMIRCSIDRWATWRFAPTQAAVLNLAREGAAHWVTVGNTSVDALRASGVGARPEASPTILVTLHRRELRERDDALEVLRALADAVETSHCDAIWPCHPGMTHLTARLRLPSNFSIRPPMSYSVMLEALSEARGLLTDSGGLVEEAAHLGVPTAIVRNANDRPEAVNAGIAVLCPPTPEGVRAAWSMLAHQRLPRRVAPVYGDGYAAEGIAEHLILELT